jgi:hypothetical protein
MKLIAVCLLVQFLVYVNGENFENTLDLIERQLEQLQEDEKMGPVEKYLKMVVLKKTLDQIIETKEHELQKIQDQEQQRKLAEQRDLEEKSKLETQIFQKYLGGKMGGSSFNKDFHTMRY